MQIKQNLTINSYAERSRQAREIERDCARAEKGQKVDLKKTAEKLHPLVQALNEDTNAIHRGTRISNDVRKAYEAHKATLSGVTARVNALSAKTNSDPAWVKPAAYTALAVLGIATAVFLANQSGIFSGQAPLETEPDFCAVENPFMKDQCTFLKGAIFSSTGAPVNPAPSTTITPKVSTSPASSAASTTATPSTTTTPPTVATNPAQSDPSTSASPSPAPSAASTTATPSSITTPSTVTTNPALNSRPTTHAAKPNLAPSTPPQQKKPEQKSTIESANGRNQVVSRSYTTEEKVFVSSAFAAGVLWILLRKMLVFRP